MKLPRDVSGDQAVRALVRLGFERQRQTGSHMILKKENRTVVVPRHRSIKPGTLKGLLEQAAISPAEFRKHIR